MSDNDKTLAILDRLTAAHGVIDSYNFDLDDLDDVRQCMVDLVDDDEIASELHGMLSTLAALLSDAGSEIARLHAENAGLRARCGT